METMLAERRGFDCRKAALYLGVSERTIRYMLASGVLPCARIGRKVVILRDDLDALLERARTQRVATR